MPCYNASLAAAASGDRVASLAAAANGDRVGPKFDSLDITQ